MATTSVYGLRYLEPTDSPTIAAATQHLAQDVEAQLARIDGDLAPPTYSSSGIVYETGAAALVGDELRYRTWTALRQVELHGGVQASTTFAQGGVDIAVLPPGVRPGQITYYAAPVSWTSGEVGTGRIEIDTDGTIRLFIGVDVSWVRLHGMRFDLP